MSWSVKTKKLICLLAAAAAAADEEEVEEEEETEPMQRETRERSAEVGGVTSLQ